MMDVIEAAEPAFRGRVYSTDEGVAEALRMIAEGASLPVVLSDTLDNPGAGANSDTTGMLRALLAAGAPGTIGNIFDIAAAHAAGGGTTFRLDLGGRSQPGDTPYLGDLVIESLSGGRFVAPGPFYDGCLMQIGPSACLQIGDVRLAVTSAKAQMADRAMFRNLGITPEAKKILVVKSSNHFRADFQPHTHAVLVCAGSRPMAVTPTDLPWRRLRPGLRIEAMGQPFAGENT
jgi:microcystin degradation protein MlrC